MADKLKHMHWKKILLVGGILMVVLVAGLCVQKPEGIKLTPTSLQPAEELKLSDFPEAFKSTLIVVGDNASDIEMQAANEIADYLENETGNKPLIKKHSEISDEDKRNYNMIVVGTPKTNPFLEEVYAMTNATRVTEEFPGEGKGVLEILPNPWDESKAVLLVEGNDEWGVKAGSEFIHQTQRMDRTKIIIDKPESPIKVNLSLSELPLLNKIVKLVFTVTALEDLPNTTIEISLPEGFELISGDLSWKGNITRGNTIQIQSYIRAIKKGNWTITAVARSVRYDKFVSIEGKADAIFISVSEETAMVSKKPPIPQLPPMEERTGIQVSRRL